MQVIYFFRTPYFLLKSDKKFAEKISDEIKDIIKDKEKIDYVNYIKEKGKSDKTPTQITGLDFKVQTSAGGFISNNGKDTKIENIPSKIRKHIIENIKQSGFRQMTMILLDARCLLQQSYLIYVV